MIFGHQQNLRILSMLLEEDRFPHAVLFAGPNNIGKRKIAIEITKYLQGNHKESFFEFSQKDCKCQICNLIEVGNFPDIIEVEKSEAQISINNIREIRKKLYIAPLYSFKIAILNSIEKLSPEASGALLKILEEPRGNTIFFLITSMPNFLAKTILSRVSIFKFSLLSREEIKTFLLKIVRQTYHKAVNLNIPKTQEEKILDLSLGRSGIAKEIIIDKKKLLSYSSLLEKVESCYKLSVFDRFLLSEMIEKAGKTEDFLFLSHFWFRDLLLAKNKLNNFSFNFKKGDIIKIAKNFSKEKIENILKEISTVKKYLSFSNTSRLLLLENLLLMI